MIKLKSLVTKSDEGFTLIELMIVIAIIGILAAIAIPQFSAYRERSYNAAAQADLRNATTAQEAYFVDNNTYSSGIATLTGSTYGLQQLSNNVTISVTGGDAVSYVMTAVHSQGGGVSYIMRGPGGSISTQ